MWESWSQLSLKNTLTPVPHSAEFIALQHHSPSAALAAPLAARNDVLSILPAPLEEESLAARLEVCDAAAIVKVGRHIAKVRRVLQSLGLETRARYIERASLADERILPLFEAPDPAPYFSMVLVHRRGEAWK